MAFVSKGRAYGTPLHTGQSQNYSEWLELEMLGVVLLNIERSLMVEAAQ